MTSLSKNKWLALIAKELEQKILTILSPAKSAEVREESQEELNLEEGIITSILKFVLDVKEKAKSLAENVTSVTLRRLSLELRSLL